MNPVAPPFIEVGTPREEHEPPIPWEPNVTREEIDRRIRDSKGSTLREIWKRLGVSIDWTI